MSKIELIDVTPDRDEGFYTVRYRRVGPLPGHVVNYYIHDCYCTIQAKDELHAFMIMNDWAKRENRRREHE